MSTEPRRVTQPAVWAAWENQVINGLYPLRRFLAASRHSVVFLSTYEAKSSFDVAIKLIPAEGPRADAQIAQWEAAAGLTHPHLLRLFDVGRCQMGGRGFVFVVMEHAEQTLAQILSRRALVADEVREMLPPALNALAFLHDNDRVHGHLKPSNMLAVGDQLKLSSDTVRPTGHAPSGAVRTSLYDPPELSQGVISTAGDIWALGMTLVEALSQRTWKGSRGQGETTTSLLSSLPPPFQETARKCLSRAPSDRPTIADLEALYGRIELDDDAQAERSRADDQDPPGELTEVEVISVLQQPGTSERTDAMGERSAPADAGTAQNISLVNLSLRAIVLALALFFGIWAFLRS